MKREEISDALNLLDEELLSETDRVRSRPAWMRPKYYRGLGTAACLILVAAAGMQFHQWLHTGVDLPSETTVEISSGDASENGSLPVLSLADWDWGGMGFEGYMAYDISELVSANPWDASIPLDRLPVYQNKLTVNEDYLVRGGDLTGWKRF